MSIDKAWWTIYFGFTFLPLMVFLTGVPLDKPVNPAYIVGLIGASGIFLTLGTALINKSEVLEHNLRYAIYLDFVIFGVHSSQFSVLLLY